MSETMLNAMEEIFEVVKQVYNVPNTPLLKEGMDAVAEDLDTINEEVVKMTKEFCNQLGRLKMMVSDLAASTQDVGTTKKTMEIVKEINILLDGE